MNSSYSEAEVFVVQPAATAIGGAKRGMVGLTITPSWPVLTTPIIGQTDTEKSLEAFRKALEVEQARLAKDRADIEAWEKH